VCGVGLKFGLVCGSCNKIKILILAKNVAGVAENLRA